MRPRFGVPLLSAPTAAVLVGVGHLGTEAEAAPLELQDLASCAATGGAR